VALLDEITYPRDLRRLDRDDLAALVDEVLRETESMCKRI